MGLVWCTDQGSDGVMSDSLTPKQEAFVREYLTNGRDASAAYRAAYDASNSTDKTVWEAASKLLKHYKVAPRIAEVVAAIEKETEITVEKVRRELGLIGFSNMADYMRITPDGDPALDFSSLTREQAAALVEVTVEDFKDGRGDDARDVRRIKFKLADKRAALVDLGKHMGMFVDRVEHSGSISLEDRRANLAAKLAGMSHEDLEIIKKTALLLGSTKDEA